MTTEDVENSGAHASNTPTRLHATSDTIESGHQAAEDPHHYHVSVEALKRAQKILIVEPARTKPAVVIHIHSHDPAMVQGIVG